MPGFADRNSRTWKHCSLGCLCGHVVCGLLNGTLRVVLEDKESVKVDLCVFVRVLQRICSEAPELLHSVTPQKHEVESRARYTSHLKNCWSS